MTTKELNEIENHLTFIIGYIIFQLTWSFIWLLVIGLTFPGDGSTDFFVWNNKWGNFIGDLIIPLPPILLTTALAYLFSNRSLKLALITFVVTSIIFAITASLLFYGAYFDALIKHFNYAISG